MQFPPVAEQLAVIRRGVEKIVPEEELRAKLEWSRKQGIPLRIKYGIDPTGVDLHLGHTVPMRKMRQFQQLGHKPVIIIGNYTALVGDPSGRDESRSRLTEDQVAANAQKYLEQVAKVIDLPTDCVKMNVRSDGYHDSGIAIATQKSACPEVWYNGDWFSEMSFLDVLQLFRKVTLRQLLSRDDFSKRFNDFQNPKATIWMHEMFYPVMQAWDSRMVLADIELGGTEQLFSFMLARHLQQFENKAQQIGIMSPILVGLDGKKRMGKSLGNYIGISDPPYEMMKKFMQLPDDCMRMYYELLTDIEIDEVNRLLAGHPKEAKVTLAKTIIGEYHDATAADEAAARWQREIGGKELQSDISEGFLHSNQLDENGCMQAALLMKELELVPSTSEAMRRIKGNAAFYLVGDEKTKINDRSELIEVVEGMIVRAGKKDLKIVRFMKKDGN